MTRPEEVFDLYLHGGAVEKRYRRLRPDVDRLPWGTLARDGIPDEHRASTRRGWTRAAFQEHRTGAACAEALRALIACRAPGDLVGMASRFVLDEMAHTEIYARLLAEVGGPTPFVYDPARLVPETAPGLPPLLEAAELVVRFYCVGEAFSAPMLRATWKAMRHPLVHEAMGRIVRDESLHGTFGWLFLDWAADELDAPARAHLAAAARATIAQLTAPWKDLPRTPPNPHAFLAPDTYLRVAERALARDVVAKLRARGLDPA